jgi:WD40 repeat protein
LYDAVFLPQKAVWLTGGRDGHIRVWSKEGKALLATPAHEAAIYRIAVHGNLIYTASRDKTVKSWNVGDLSFVSKWSHMNGGAKRSVNALTIGGTNQDQLLSAGDDRMIRILPINA